MLLAAADPTGDATTFWRAAQTFGVGRDAAATRRNGAAARDRFPRAVSASAGEISLVRGRRARDVAAPPLCRCRRGRLTADDRRATGVASGGGGHRTRRSRCGGTREHGRPSSGPSRVGGGRGLPSARGRIDRGSHPARGPQRWRRPKPTWRRARSIPLAACWPRPAARPSTTFNGRGSSSSGGGSSGPRIPAPAHPCLLVQAAKRLESTRTSRSPERPISTLHGSRPWSQTPRGAGAANCSKSREGRQSPRLRNRRNHATCCSMASPQ